ncbi:PIN domain-containing protein [Candidatus Methylobacter oryzae]|uniref:Type II toxin-antitoxin system VapC family toxin n=1 Tax=Candidatus Methylobacter oryzae TaxID=2497749 RepID=A0ABY3CHE2_9GAMM|nr:PIN domain-containing protein [Candidatus Methylobacter oryzae]TRX03250.1 type II toxin-antitoxin system VapC family toxin [Candidatus Methylobacter oryzae]
MSLVDANIVLRYLLDDHAELSAKAAAILEQQTGTLPIEAACEVVYVLQKVYAVDREEIRQLLTGLLNEALVTMEKPQVFVKALEYFGSSSLDFVDTLLCAYRTVEGQEVFTFD